MRVDVDNGGYTSASSDFYDCNHGITDAVSTLNSAAGDGGGMGGHDSGGQAWGAQYDTAAQYQTAGSDGDADPNHWIETLQPASLPSAQGGTGDQPGWWHYLVSHLRSSTSRRCATASRRWSSRGSRTWAPR